MKNLLKKLTALIAVLAILMNMAVMVSAQKDMTTAEAIHFNSDGKLRIMHVTDTHLSTENIEDSVWLIAEACDRENPDIVIITGDIAMASTVEETFYKTDRLMSVLESRNIPVAVTFGNHDSESGIISREALMAYYNDNYDCSISVDDGALLSGCGTYNIPVLGSKDNEMKFNIWMFDSGDYDGEGHYSCVKADQVQWYTEKSEAIEKENGRKINSLAFQHIIVADVYEALKETKLWGAYSYKHMYFDTYYRFDKSVKNYGMLHEKPCSGYYNYGQFSAMAERGDVLAMFTGHDHTNAFGVIYKDIDIVNSLSTRYNGDLQSAQYGYRMIEIDENDTSTYKTKVVRWYDFFDGKDMKALRKSGDEHIKTARSVRFNGFFTKLGINLGVFFVQMFTGRTVRYPD